MKWNIFSPKCDSNDADMVVLYDKRIQEIEKRITGSAINIGSLKTKFSNTKNLDIVKRPDVDFVCDIAKPLTESLVIKLGKYDTIIFTEVIEHISDVGIALSNIKKLMKDNAILIITTPNIYSFVKLLKLFIGKKPDTNLYSNDRIIYDTHVSGYSKDLLKNCLMMNGFEIIESKIICGHIPFTRLYFPMGRFGDNILVVAKL